MIYDDEEDETLLEIFGKHFDRAKDRLSNRINSISGRLEKLISKMFKDYDIGEEFEYIALEDIVDIAKKNIVAGSDGVCLYKERKSDGTYFLMTYCKGNELMPEKSNKTIVLRASEVDKKLLELFKGSNTVILR